MAGTRGMLAAKQPLVVPMLLRLSHFKLNSYVVLVVSRQKGITLVFKTDPLQNVDINSTFDSIAVIQKFIQREIEGQLRQMFREDLPGIIHRLSQQWVKAKVEAPYLSKRPPTVRPRNFETASAPDVSGRMPSRVGPLHPPMARSQSASRLGLGFGRGNVSSAPSVSSVGRKVSSTPSSPPPDPTPTPEGPTSFPFLEQFDPTYGLRPERIPTKSVFTSFRSLFAPNKGLADLKEEPSDIDDDEGTSFDASNWDDFLSESQYSTAPPQTTTEYEEPAEEYETVPAVGGGTITRPRIIHSQSQVKIDTGDGLRSPLASSSQRPIPPRLSTMPRSYDSMPPPHSSVPLSYLSPTRDRTPHTAPLYNPYFAGTTPLYDPNGIDDDEEEEESPTNMIASRNPFERIRTQPLSQMPSGPSRRPASPSSIRTHLSRSSDATHSVPTPPHEPDDDSGIRINRSHRPSFSSLHNMDQFYTGSPPDHFGSHFSSSTSDQSHVGKIVLKPAINNSVSRLSTLSHSNHTLSPYTRTLEHFTVRSVPPRETTSSGSGSAGERPPVKAKRKRMYKLGGKSAKPSLGPDAVEELRDANQGPRSSASASEPQSPAAPMSDFDVSDMDRYFRARDDFVPHYPDIHPSHLRRRFSLYQNQAQL